MASENFKYSSFVQKSISLAASLPIVPARLAGYWYLYRAYAHTLWLEDTYGLKIGEIDGEICLRLDKSDYSTYSSMFDMFHAWQEQAAKLEQGEISREEYDQWRYKYLELDTSKHWAKVPTQAVSDMLMDKFQKIKKEENKKQKKKKA